MNINILPPTHCLSQPLTPIPALSQKLLRVSSKRKLLLSPSKDLMVFFGNSSFNKFNTVKVDQAQKKHNKLTLDRKCDDGSKNMQQKKQQKQKCEGNKIQRVLSIASSVESRSTSKNRVSQDQERFLKLKRQVDQIRRKYSYNKIGQKSLLSSVHSSEKLGVSTENTSNNSSQSINNSKEKLSILTPKNERYLGKRILTKNVFAEQHSSKLRLSQSKPLKTLKMNTQQSQEMRRKKSYELSDLTSSVNFSTGETDQKLTFQFTFGSMAMMDFQNKGNLKPKVNKLKM